MTGTPEEDTELAALRRQMELLRPRLEEVAPADDAVVRALLEHLGDSEQEEQGRPGS